MKMSLTPFQVSTRLYLAAPAIPNCGKWGIFSGFRVIQAMVAVALILLPEALHGQATVTVVNASPCTVVGGSGAGTYVVHLNVSAYYNLGFGTLPPGITQSVDVSSSFADQSSQFELDQNAGCYSSHITKIGSCVFILGPCCSAVPPDDGGDAGTATPPGCGMPVWSVSEPFTSLWLRDEPMSYQPALGPRIALELDYKQREYTAGLYPDIFSVGRRWNFSWFSFVSLDTAGSNVVHYAGGRQYTFQSQNDFLTYARITGSTNSGFTLAYPDGRQDVYGFIVTNNFGVFQQAFLTEQGNAQAQKTRFYYSSYNPTNPVVRLQNVVDGDGRTNWIYYVTNNGFSTNFISQVVDAFGRTNFLAYDDKGYLTNSVDVMGLSSSFGYDSNGWITNMVTPYGTTSFACTETTAANIAPNGRSVLVTQPDGGQQLYLHTNSAPGIASSYATGEVPVTTPFANTFENVNLQYRNSFHWGVRQYAALSTTNIAVLSTNDFRLARMQHFLTNDTMVVSPTPSMERDPSPDRGGAVAGQKTWYDYAGKTNNAYPGTQSLPLFVARVLPDGAIQFGRTERNALGRITQECSTFSSNSAVVLRTNAFSYSTNLIDLLTATNALGVRVSSNSYNAFHQALTNFNALNEKVVFVYDASNRLSTVTLPTGLVTTNTYGTNGFLAQQIVVGIATNSFTYSNDLVLTHTDTRGLRTTNIWDNLQRLRRVDFPDGTFITNSYDKLDLVLAKDRMGYTNAFGYNAVRQMTSTTDALGRQTLYDYCSCGALNSIRDAANNYTWFFYDNAGRQTNAVYADGYSVTNRYDLLGQLTNVIDSAGSNVTNWFNNQGLLVISSNAFGRINLATYDVLDRMTNSVDANGVTITNTFDNLNRLLTRGYPDGGVEKYAYTLNYAAVTGYTNQLGTNVVNYAYDAMGRKTNEVYPGITTNRYTYSGASDLLTLKDGKNQTTTWHYDEYGRTTNKVDATSTEIYRFSYDPNNRLTNRWTAAKGNTVYRYDSVGNLTNVDYAVSPDLTMQYDSLNRLTNLVDAVGTSRYTYDAASQLLSEDGPWASDTLSYTYANRLRASLSLQQPSGSWTNGYSYDVSKRLTNITSPAGSFGYQYPGSRPSALVARLSLPNNAYITNSYDSVTRLLSTQLKNSGGTVLNSHTYAYNAGNQRTKQTRTDGSYVDYTYDGVSELKTALGKESGGATSRLNEQMGYAYDPAGNLNFRTNNALVQTFNNNSLNEISTVTRSGTLTVEGNTSTAATNVTVNGLTAIRYADLTYARTNFPLVDATTNFTAIAQSPIGLSSTNTVTVDLRATTTLVYDLNGNVRTNGTQILEYDDENHLVTNWVAAAWKSEFVYDGVNRRRIQRDYSWQGGAWTKTNEVRLVYDGSVILQHRDGNNSPTLTLTRGLDLSGSFQAAGGIGGLLALTESSGNSSYYHADGGGNVTALANTNQLIVARYLYDPFGNTLAISGPKAFINPYRFSSKPIHDASGKYDFLRRWYDPSIQRWLNRDPIGELGGINLYRYVGNNPVNSIDLLGLCPGDFWDLFGNGLNNTVTGVGRSLGLGLYDLSTLQWSQDQWNQIDNTLYSVSSPENPAATPYIEGALGVSAGATAIASWALSSEVLASQGFYDVAGTIENRASQPFLQNASSRWFSTIQTDTLLNGARLANTDAGLYNALTTFRYAAPGGGEVVLNWITRTIVHANPFF